MRNNIPTSSNASKGEHVENYTEKLFELAGYKSMLPSNLRVNGNQGIDHVFYKEDANGNIIEMIIAESKYNTSKLGNTNFGKQMSNSPNPNTIINSSKIDTFLTNNPNSVTKLLLRMDKNGVVKTKELQ